MAHFYLRPINDETEFSDFADYPGEAPPFEAPAGLEWIEGDPPEDAFVYKRKSLAEKLEEIFIGALSENQGLVTDEQIADMFILKAGITEMLRFGQVNPAKSKIMAFEVPEGLQAVKTQMLSLFE